MKKIITFLLLLPIFSYAQKQGNIWYFGGSFTNQSNYGAGLDFNAGPPAALSNSGMRYTEGSAAYCNSAGQLLFYAQGDTVFDKTHNIMANGAGLGGHWSTAQSTLIVPTTGDTNKFYIFSNDGLPTSNGTGLHYSIIDMQQNTALGAVTEPKATNLLVNTSEQLTGCKHANGSDFWVITTTHDSTIFYAFQVTPTGVFPPVISNVGFNNSTIGNIEISPNADKLAIKILNSNQYTRQLIDFDNATGVCSNPLSIGKPTGFNTGCGFSPNGSIFYDIERNFLADSIYQYNLTVASIPSSKTLIYSRPSKSQFDTRIGPDGKLYFSGNSNFSFLDVINFPNVLGAGCNFQANAVSLAGFSGGLMLPNESLIASSISTPTTDKILNKNMRVYPNPTSSRLILETNAASFLATDNFQIYSMLGKKIQTIKITAPHSPIDLSNQPRGAYLLIANLQGKQQTFKIIKK